MSAGNVENVIAIEAQQPQNGYAGRANGRRDGRWKVGFHHLDIAERIDIERIVVVRAREWRASEPVE